MRPYKFASDWLDLDQVQSISELTAADRMGCGGYFVEVYVQFAFQDKPRVFTFQQPTVWMRNGEVVEWAEDMGTRLAPKLIDGKWSALVELQPEWQKLLDAWKGTK